MATQTRTPYFTGSTEVLTRKLIRKYLQVMYPDLDLPKIAGAIRAAGPAIENVIAYVKRKYYGIRTFKEMPRPMPPGPQGTAYLEGIALTAGKGEEGYIKVHLHDLRDFDEQLIYDFFELQDSKNFEIIIERDWEGSKKLNAIQFMGAAYIGDRLALAADHFSYLVPSETCSDPFRFFLYGSNLGFLANTLSFAVAAYYPTDGGDAAHHFNRCANELRDNCAKGIEGCNTAGLVDISLHLWGSF